MLEPSFVNLAIVYPYDIIESTVGHDWVSHENFGNDSATERS